MSTQTWTYIFVGLTFALYLGIAWLSRVKDTKGFYVAGRGVPAIANGMATGADWMSAASFISMAGLISISGYAGGVYLMGWTGGYVLLALLLAPYLRRFGSYTVPDFIGDRYPSRANIARFVAVICAIFVSFTYVVGQMKGVGVVFSRFLDVSLEQGVFIGMVIVFIYATLGGMKGITWTQVAQYWVLITAFLIPAIAISIKLTGNPIPQVGLGSQVLESVDPARPYLLDKLNQINTDFGFGSYTEPFTQSGWSMLNVFCVTVALMAGTAGLPHVIVRFYTVKNVAAARWSAFWALLFIAMLYLTAPAVGAFARYYMIDPVAGLNGRSVEELPQWYTSWNESAGLIAWVDFDGDGTVRYAADETNELLNISALPPETRDAINADPTGWVIERGGADSAMTQLRELGAKFQPDADLIVLATPEMANLANWIIAFIAAGGLAAALSTASGLLLVVSSSVAHDLYFRVMNPQASEKQRLLVGRIVIALAVMVAGYFGVNPPGFVGEVVAFAFGLAAASFFPAIVLGIFTKRLSAIPAVAGMVVGITFTGFYILTQTGDNILGTETAALLFGEPGSWLREPWIFGINAKGIGTIGMLVNFAVTLGLMPFCKPPEPEVQAMIESLRLPEDETAAVDLDESAAALH
ncbi:MAG: sodium:solute symporter family protein [Planctomycetota bacterium]